MLGARARSNSAACPNCGDAAGRVHGRYVRKLRDVAIGGVGVVIRLTVRRFRCQNPACRAVTFAEQIPGLTSPHSRFTPLLLDEFDAIGLALAGRAGARLSAKLGIAVSRHTLLRRVRALPESQSATGPQVLGIDDFALRKGHVYGTVLIDMTTRRPVELLPERTAGPVAAWLLAHPGVEVICRDRAGAYAEAARLGAPDALQVADRWHLWNNLCEAVEKTVARHRGCLREPVAGPAAPATLDLAATEATTSPLAIRTIERHRMVHELLDEGATLTKIQRKLGWDAKTVRRYADADNPSQLMGGVTRPSVLDDFKPYVIERWNAGITDAVVITAELRDLGYEATDRTVRRFLAPYRKQAAKIPAVPVPPTVRDATGWLTRHPEGLSADEQQRLKGILARCPELDDLSGLVTDFAKMMVNLDGHLLNAWITEVRIAELPDLIPFTRGIVQDHAAVTAGLTLPFSSGAVEGHVNRIKMLKRQMYGRAKFDLLRKRVIYARRSRTRPITRSAPEPLLVSAEPDSAVRPTRL
ncbi:ISL3 family transposase [Catenulispora sp. NL8]|uniref:ISL3 family transposase n=1 Tax=Catenulispora pinistramenti TaxID=2705254 RepID=A0ABS5KU89_9ACTN|nr:ISL3 family transposase [Catenulispora pinistramenti]MBS2549621.1 ISL3 family transposase [Catenulispora pinistramenti]